MSCEIEEAAEAGMLKFNVHWATKGDEKAAEQLQERSVMARVVELFRGVDISNKTKATQTLVSFIIDLQSIDIKSAELKTQLQDLIDLGVALTKEGVFCGDASRVKIAKDKIMANAAHRLHKTITLLPGGSLLMSLIDPPLAQHEADHKARDAFKACLADAKKIPKYEREVNETDNHEMCVPEKPKYDHLRKQFLAVISQVSEKCKTEHADDIAEIKSVLEEFAVAIRVRINAYNNSVVKPLVEGFTRLLNSEKNEKECQALLDQVPGTIAKLKAARSLSLGASISEEDTMCIEADTLAIGGLFSQTTEIK